MYTYFVQAVIALVISYALSYVNKPKPQKPIAGELDIPDIRPGALLGVSFGTNWQRAPIIVDYFDPFVEPIKVETGK